MSGYSSNLPNVEITSKPIESIVASTPFFGAGRSRMGPTINAFNIYEGEENVHNVVNEEEELLIFQQRTIETSQLVVNCQFPLVAAHLEKEVFDTLQLRANDLQTWLLLFSEKLATDVQTFLPPVTLPPRYQR